LEGGVAKKFAAWGALAFAHSYERLLRLSRGIVLPY